MMKFLAAAASAIVVFAISFNASAQETSSDISIVGGAHVVTVPFELIDNRIFVSARVNGRGPFHIVFDTGASNIVTPQLAHSAGITLTDESETTGVGEGVRKSWHAQVGEATLGAVRQRNMDFLVTSLEEIRRAIGFAHFDGIFGAELLQRFVVRIDYDHRRLSFAEPGHAPSAWFSGTSIPISFVSDRPVINARVNGLDVRAMLDTGDRSSLTLFGPFSEAHHLRADGSARLRAVTGWGVGGPVPADVGRAAQLDFSGFTLRNVTARLPATRSGIFASDEVDASIGTGVIKRFAMTLDYAHSRIVLRPGVHLGDSDPFDRSGMWLRQTEDASAIEVFDVTPNTPASVAGVRAGELVVGLDRRRLHGGDLIALRGRLSTARDGERIALRIRGANGERDATLTVREPNG